MQKRDLTPPDDIDPAVMRACLWSGIVLVVGTCVAMMGLLHFMPPPSPATSAQDLLALVQSRQTAILAGDVVLFIAGAFWITWVIPIIVYIRRMERAPILTYSSLANAGGCAFIINAIPVIWAVMAFRAQDLRIVQLLYDLGWFMFLYTWPPFAIWMICIATAILRNVRNEPIYPRWAAYYNICCALLMLPGSFIGFFKTGPFAYNGLLAFWLVGMDFFVWMIVMTWLTFRAVALDVKQMALRDGSYAPPTAKNSIAAEERYHG